MSVEGKTKIPDDKRKDMGSLSKFYLLSYNGIQTIGWGYLLIETVRHLLIHKSPAGLWSSHGTALLIFQSLAALEVVNCIVKLVPSNPFMTAMQVASRLFQVWGIVYSVPDIQDVPTIPLLFLAWSLTETVRYAFYFTSLLGKSSKLLTWCRYSFFYVLYPAGVCAEAGNALQALSVIKRKQLYSFPLPNPANISFSYYYLNIFILLSYIPFFPQLFNHMRKQRAKVLSPKEDTKSKKIK